MEVYSKQKCCYPKLYNNFKITHYGFCSSSFSYSLFSQSPVDYCGRDKVPSTNARRLQLINEEINDFRVSMFQELGSNYVCSLIAKPSKYLSCFFSNIYEIEVSVLILRFYQYLERFSP